MNAALLYRPGNPWRSWSAFAAAIVIHLGALALAGRAPESPARVVLPSDPFVEFVDDLRPETSPSETPEEAPPAPPPPVTEDSWVSEERLTPPLVPRSIPSRIQPPSRPPPSGTPQTGRAFALNAPRPEYPYEARRQHLTGSGIATFTVDGAGNVLAVAISRSTGSPILDQAALAGFRRWRFRPGTPARVQTPVTFTLTGAAF